jgi:hypothetical protein
MILTSHRDAVVRLRRYLYRPRPCARARAWNGAVALKILMTKGMVMPGPYT